jgi:hypothetical protein
MARKKDINRRAHREKNERQKGKGESGETCLPAGRREKRE